MEKEILFSTTENLKNNKIILPLDLGIIQKENKYYWIKDDKEILYHQDSEEFIYEFLTKPCHERYILIKHHWLYEEDIWIFSEMSKISLTNFYVGMELERIFRIFNPTIIRLVSDGDNNYRKTKFRIDKYDDHDYFLNIENIIYILEITSQDYINRLRNPCIDVN